MTLSVCMIVRDEEAVLARCLNSLKDAADEIVIVDTGSTDATPAIARQFTDRIFPFPGRMTFPPHATPPSGMPAASSSCGWMPTT